MAVVWSHNEELDKVVTELMNEFEMWQKKAQDLGFKVCYAPGSKPLVLYYNEDYPDMILVDKYFSQMNEEEV